MKTVSLIAAVVVFGSSSVVAQNSIEGHWEGTMVRDAADLSVSFDFINEPTGLRGSFSSPTQRALSIPLRNVSYTAPNLHFLLIGDVTTMIFDGVLTTNIISGQFREGNGRGDQFREGDARGGAFHPGDARGKFSLKHAEQKSPSFKEEELSFRNRDITLSGTLLLPLAEGPYPAVIFLHGSGAEGREANRFVAEYLTRYGIAALIYDKRGVGKSTGDWQRSDFNDLAEDTIAAISVLQKRNDIDPKKIGIHGFSQGGMIAPLVASRSRDVAFVINGSGQGVPLYEGEINSIANQVRSRGISGNDLNEAIEFIKMWVNVARTGEGWDGFETAIEKARDRNWFRAIRVPPKDDWTWAFFKRIYEYNAADYWTKVDVPVLVMYGERDMFTPISQSIANIDGALRKARNDDYTIVVFPRASHAFFIEPAADQAFEWPRLAPGYLDVVVSWIKQRMK